ncbi:MAG: NlpC/P60 family protein, partial [Spirochaetota bacterium]
MTSEVEILRRAHDLFAGSPTRLPLDAVPAATAAVRAAGLMADTYQVAASDRSTRLRDAGDVDSLLIRILGEAHRAHGEAQGRTAAVLAAARADTETVADNP